MIVTLFTLMAVRIGGDFMETGRLTGLLLLASEILSWYSRSSGDLRRLSIAVFGHAFSPRCR